MIMQKLKKTLYVISILVMLFIAVLIYIPIKDTIFGVPFDAQIAPNVLSDNSFNVAFDVPCNRFYLREIGFRIDPPIEIASVKDAQLSVLGYAKVNITQGVQSIKEDVDLSATGWSLNSNGIWSKVITRYQPIGSFFCTNQNIVLNVNNMNIDLNKYTVSVYVSRDRRP